MVEPGANRGSSNNSLFCDSIRQSIVIGLSVQCDDNFSGNRTVSNADLTLVLNNWGVDLSDLLCLRDVTGGGWHVTQADVDFVIPNNIDLDGDGHSDLVDKAIVEQQLGLDLSASIVT